LVQSTHRIDPSSGRGRLKTASLHELRQGVGRLIRTKQDKGIVVILDPRVLTKNYGSAFLRALPKCPVEVV
jgi:Rad3-related DNA helicase